MVKRLWPALSLAGALLLAAASLHAEDSSQLAVAGIRSGRSVQAVPSSTMPPTAGPAIPGDDDMPNRGSRYPTGSGSGFGFGKADSPASPSTGWRLYDVLVIVRQHGLAFLVLYR